MSEPTTFVNIRNATSSQGSEDGASPSDLRCGLTIDLFGQEAVPASPSPQPEKAKHQAMNATSGPNGSDLSELADRQQSLANRLKRQLDGVGSTLFTLTWNRKATPLGRPYYQHVASERRTEGIDFGSLPSPMARDWQDRTRPERLSYHDKRESGGGILPRRLGTILLPSGLPDKPMIVNPWFSLMLMGYPPEWLNCAPPAMRSSRKSRPSS
jgi:hypothetical protein